MTAPASTVFVLRISDYSTLQSAWMPMIKGGGLFISTSGEYLPGTQVFLLLHFDKNLVKNRDETLAVAGNIVWITSSRPLDKRRQGIGVRFCDRDGAARRRINAMLAGQPEELVASFIF
ncbi:MAG: PilZ domain-containing protein [Pseudohongiellaceae bacterium]